MSRDKALEHARKTSVTSSRYVVYDGEDFGADNVGQGGYQVCRDADLEGFYQGCEIIACFEHGQFQE